uniref:Si:dkeyp-94b4.1 n=2 Tax=Nothobranchius korthausae TaxID=1143690 RepID=A0A1A8G1X8_9TELE
MVSLPSFGKHLSTHIGSKLRTNDQICGSIAEKIAKFRASSMSQKGEGSFPHANNNMPQDGREELHQTSTSYMDQQRLRFAALNPGPTEKGCPQILPEETVTLAKSKKKSLLVPSDISATTWDKVPEKCPSSTLCCTSSQLHGRKDLEKQDVGIDYSTGVESSNITKNSEDKQHCHFAFEGNVHVSKRSLSQNSSCSGEEFEHQLSPKCQSEKDFGGQIGSCFGLKDEFESQTDDEDDIWDVIPLNIDNLSFEQADYQPNPEYISQNKCEHEVCRATKAVPASAFLKMEVFDTPDEQKQTFKCGQLSFVVPSSCCSHESFMQRKDSSSEHEDCCETNDSGTVCRDLKKSFSEPVKPKTDYCGSEKKSYKMASLQESQAWGRPQEDSQEESIIIIDSDSESDIDCMEKQERDKICLPVDQQHHVNTNFTQGTEKCGLNQNEKCRQRISNDEHIIILSDSDDDDYREMSNITKETSILESMDNGNSEMAKSTLLNKKPLADFLKPTHDLASEHEKLKTSREVMPANCNSYESKRKANNDSQEKKRVVSPEREDDDNDLHITRSDLSAERKRVKTTVYNPRSNQKSKRLAEPDTPLGDSPVNIQPSRLSLDKGGSSSDPSKATSKNDLTSKLRHLLREKQNKKTKPLGVYNVVKSDQSSLQPRRRVVSPKQRAPFFKPDSATSYPPFAPQNGTSSLTTPKSIQGTSHARSKILNDWKQQHVPLRRERRFYKGARRERKFYKGAKHLKRTL